MLTDVHVSLAHLDDASWIVTGYLIGYVAALPLMGRVSDVHGRRPVYLLALLVFAFGSLLCATARSLPWLVAARVVQAIGGGATLPVTLALVGDLVPSNRRALPLGIIGAAAEAGGVVGPVYGAGIVQAWGWRWIFLINLPLAGLIAAFVWRAMPASGQPVDAGEPAAYGRPGKAVDYLGAALFACSITALTVGLSGAGNPLTSRSPIELKRAVPLTLLALLAGVAFVWRQARAASPLLPLGMLRHRFSAAANTVNFFIGVALIAAMVDVPLFAATVLGRSPLTSGLALLRLTVCIPVGAIAGGWLVHRLGVRVTGVSGLVAAAAGFLLMSGWSLHVTDPAMTPGLVLAGIGFGLVIAPVIFAALEPVEERDRGLASALVMVMRMVGMTVGLAALTSVAFFRFNQLVSNVQLPFQRSGETAAAYAQRFQAYEEAIAQAGQAVFSGVFSIA
ncbi:MAG: MFS transporter, partial [Chloroflexota bacterium]|nr:MFS transporter [Chloroflexota bacterium]